MKRILVAVLLAAALTAGCTAAQPKPAAQSAQAAQQPMVNITPADLQKLLQGSGKQPLVVDVRTPEEYAEGHIAGAKLVPLQTIETDIKAIAKDQEIVLVCRSGNRSAQAYEILAGMGYKNLKNMTGGMTEWQKIGAPVTK